mgnify:CR=1 FL=1
MWIERGVRCENPAGHVNVRVVVAAGHTPCEPRGAPAQRILQDVAVLGDVSANLNMARLTGGAQKIAADLSRLSAGGNVVTVKTGPLEGDGQ